MLTQSQQEKAKHSVSLPDNNLPGCHTFESFYSELLFVLVLKVHPVGDLGTWQGKNPQFPIVGGAHKAVGMRQALLLYPGLVWPETGIASLQHSHAIEHLPNYQTVASPGDNVKHLTLCTIWLTTKMTMVEGGQSTLLAPYPDLCCSWCHQGRTPSPNVVWYDCKNCRMGQKFPALHGFSVPLNLAAGVAQRWRDGALLVHSRRGRPVFLSKELSDASTQTEDFLKPLFIVALSGPGATL